VIIRRQIIEESSAPCAGKSKSFRIPIGHSVRGFIVPGSNSFATVIPLDILAELSRKRSQITWSDINPAWPRRPIQWVFSSQTDFKDDLRILGITPPSQYLLAANYDRGFMNIPDHPDSLLFSPTSPSLSSLLQGAQFRLLPIQITRNGKPIKPEPEPEELERYPQELVRTVYLYINPDSPSSCFMFDFADFILSNNKQLMHENNFIPLRQNEITTALQQLRESRARSYKESQPLCSGYQALFDQTNQPAQSTKP
jgi:ABC-type phosphate transport system substrate-binding protein